MGIAGSGGCLLRPDGSKPVAWLKLQVETLSGNVQVPDEMGDAKEAYRVNTAEGTPLNSACEGQLANFDVKYTAKYWLLN